MATTKYDRLQRRKKRVRRNIIGTAERPRLAFRRTLRHLRCEVIDDTANPSGSVALIQLTTDTKDKKAAGDKSWCNKDAAKKLAEELVEKAKEKGFTTMVFDRGGSRYHGVVKVFCDAVRENGIKI